MRRLSVNPVMRSPQPNRDLDHRADLQNDEADVAHVMDGKTISEPRVFIFSLLLLLALAIAQLVKDSDARPHNRDADQNRHDVKHVYKLLVDRLF